MSRPDLDEFIHRARGLYRRQAMDAAAVEIIVTFETAGVEALLLKGPVLARVLYGPDDKRGYQDIDLLVAPDHIAKARTALVGLGYQGGPELSAVDDVAGLQNTEVWWRESPVDGAGAIEVDLHWRLFGCEAPADVAWTALTARGASVEIEGRRVGVLDRSGLALHMATHAAQHGPGDLKAMGDLVRGVESWPIDVWRAAATLAEEVDAVGAFSAGLRLVPVGETLASKLDLPAADEVTWSILNREARPRGTFHLDALSRASGLSGRLDVLRRSLLPVRQWIIHEYPWAANGRGRLVVAYVAHLLRAPLWAARTWRYRRRERTAARRRR